MGGTALLYSKVPDLYPEQVRPGDPPDVVATRDAARSQAVVTTRASVLAALAGAGALVTIAINYRNSRTEARTLATTQETFRITERGLLTDRSPTPSAPPKNSEDATDAFSGPVDS